MILNSIVMDFVIAPIQVYNVEIESKINNKIKNKKVIDININIAYNLILWSQK